MSYQNIQTETKGRVGIIRFNRPQALNALNAGARRKGCSYESARFNSTHGFTPCVGLGGKGK